MCVCICLVHLDVRVQLFIFIQLLIKHISVICGWISKKQYVTIDCFEVLI